MLLTLRWVHVHNIEIINVWMRYLSFFPLLGEHVKSQKNPGNS